MNAGGSGELCTTHVRFIVEPLSMYKSGAPIISVDGSICKKKLKKRVHAYFSESKILNFLCCCLAVNVEK
jgi:hypothetical protein